MCMLWCYQAYCAFFFFLPYAWLFIMPVYGAFCGTQPVFRFSLMLCLQAVVISLIPRDLKFIVPYVQTFCFLLLLWLPMSWLPEVLVSVYAWLTWLSEPFWLYVEVAILLHVVLFISDTLITRIEEEDQISTKLLVLTISGVCYVTTTSLALSYIGTESLVLTWFVVVTLVLGLLNHIGMMADLSGYSCEAACVGLVSLLMLFCWQQDTYSQQHPLPVPDIWKSLGKSESVIGSLLSLPVASLESANRSIQFIKKLFSVVFLTQAVLRLYSVWFVVDRVQQSLLSSEQDEDDPFDEDEDGLSGFQKWLPSRSPLIFNLAFIFVYTQIVTQHLDAWTASENLKSDQTERTYTEQILDLHPGRLLQMLALNLTYLWKLYQSYHDVDIF